MIACFSITCALFTGVVSALEQDEARITPVWSNETPYPGSTVTVEIFLINSYSDDITVQRIGVHLDWMDPDNFVGHDISDAPVTIPSDGSYKFQSITIVVPQDASVGAHNYFVGVDGIQGASTPFSWDSQTRILQIQGSDGSEQVSNESAGTDGQPDQSLIILGVAAVVAVVAVLMVIFIFRRNRKKTVHHS